MHTQEEAIAAIKRGDNVFISGSAGCVDKYTEFLTPNGWKYISDYEKGDKVGQVSEKGLQLTFCTPLKYIKKECSEFNRVVGNRGVEQWICDDHQVAYCVKDKNKLNKLSIKDIKERHERNASGFSGKVPQIFNYQGHKKLNLTEAQIRLGVALKADGHICPRVRTKGDYKVRLKKPKKVERFFDLLKGAKITYEYYYEDKTGFTIFNLKAPWCSKSLYDWIFCEKKDAEIIIDEYKHWDGDLVRNGNRLSNYYTTNEKDADAMQYFASVCGYRANIILSDRVGQEYKTNGKIYIRKSQEYTVVISKQTHTSFLYKDARGRGQSLDRIKSEDGKKYCFTVPTGYLLFRRGGRIFVSGNCGKSYVINNSINRKTTVIAAPTGIAALNVGGETCHSLFGLPTGLPSEKDKFFISPKMKDIFGEGSNVQSIILDECSMLRADYFDLISDKLRIVKGNDLPFGGLQIIIVGDLFQLPPILNKEESKLYRRMRYKSVWVFHAKCFEECNFTNIVLSKIYRQDNKEQIEVLNGIRQGIDLDYNIAKINEWCTRDLKQERLNLCTYNRDADKINNEEFKKNPNPVKIYEAIVKGKFNAKDCIVPKTLELKLGLRVIICANGLNYRNGEMGEILSLRDDLIVVRKDNGDIVEVEPFTWDALAYKRGLKGDLRKSTKGSMEQFPLKMGYAISVHKSQSLTLDNLYIDFGYKVRSEGLVYVALSRTRDLNNIYLKRDLGMDDIIIDKHVKKYYERLQEA